MLTGEPFETLVDACRRQAAEEAAAKVVNLADMRTKLRPLLTAATTES
jgi:ADP-ribose pyrophosphatase YjhB (NUDIX family)